MSNLWAQETTVSERDDGFLVTLGESEVYETFTEDRGELFRSSQRAYGRCTGNMYNDSDGKTAKVGWVFQSRRPYEDDPTKSSLIETWVSVHTGPPTVTTRYHYASEVE